MTITRSATRRAAEESAGQLRSGRRFKPSAVIFASLSPSASVAPARAPAHVRRARSRPAIKVAGSRDIFERKTALQKGGRRKIGKALREHLRSNRLQQTEKRKARPPPVQLGSPSPQRGAQYELCSELDSDGNERTRQWPAGSDHIPDPPRNKPRESQESRPPSRLWEKWSVEWDAKRDWYKFKRPEEYRFLDRYFDNDLVLWYERGKTEERYGDREGRIQVREGSLVDNLGEILLGRYPEGEAWMPIFLAVDPIFYGETGTPFERIDNYQRPSWEMEAEGELTPPGQATAYDYDAKRRGWEEAQEAEN